MQRLAQVVLVSVMLMISLRVHAANVLSDRNMLMPELGKTWLTYTTPHFHIHFETGSTLQARQVAAIAERVHARLQPWLGWQPRDRTEIVLLDTVDVSNGMASPFPFNEITLYLQHPSDGELMDQQPWLEMVLTHEYVHILHLDLASGGPLAVRNVFGRSMDPLILMDFPQLMAPGWVTEGLAVYGESRSNMLDGQEGTGSRFGRLNNAYFDGLMRMEVQRGLYGLSEVSYNSGFRWPYGQHYLYGAYFFQFVEARYGKDAVANYIKVYGSNLIPFRMDKRSQQIFHQSAQQVWHEFQQYLQDAFVPQLEAIRQQGDLHAQPVFTEPDVEYALTPAPDGALYFVHDDHASRPMVRRLNRDGSTDYVLDGRGVQEIDYHPQAGLLLAKWTVCNNTNINTDLYVWQRGMSEPRRITQCGRYLYAAWRPDGNAIAAVQASQGITRLVLLDAQGGLLQTLAEFPLSETLGQIDWSPDGKSIVATVQRSHGGWGLEWLDVTSGQWHTLLRDGSLLQRPHFSADGKSVIFLSDHGKVWNLRQLMLANHHLQTLSNTQSILSDAVQMADGSYRALENTAEGTRIIALDGEDSLPTMQSPAGPLSNIEYATSNASATPPADGSVQPYSPWHTLGPHAWFPVVDSSAGEASYAGLLLQGRDALSFHRWQALPLYFHTLKAAGGIINYSFYNTLLLSAENLYYMFDNSTGTARYQDQETRYQVSLQHDFNSYDSSWHVAGGAAHEKLDWQVYTGSGSNAVYRNTLAGATLAYDNTRVYKRSISPEDGRHLVAQTETYDALGGSDFSGKTSLASWQEYFSLGASQVLYLRGIRAEGDAGIRPYQLGGASETLSQIGGQTGLGRRSFLLRGYRSGAAGLAGTSMALANLEWRLPLGYHYDGWMAPPVGIGRESLALFADVGDAWYAGETAQYRIGIGAEWHGELLLGFDLLHVNATLGVARGLNENGESQLYFRASLPLL